MGRVWVHAGELDEGRIQRLEVKLGSLPRRIIDRDTALAWLKDHHSFIPLIDGSAGPCLQLVEVDEEQLFIRSDTDKVAEDSLPALPVLQG